MVFVGDGIEHSRRLKCLTIGYDYTKEAIDIPVDHGIVGGYVTRVLDRVGAFRGLPRVLRSDQGPEFTGNALDCWAYSNRVSLRLIQVGKPTRNACVEGFISKFHGRAAERTLVPRARRGPGDHWGVALRLYPTPTARPLGYHIPEAFAAVWRARHAGHTRQETHT